VTSGGRELDDYPDDDCTGVPLVRIIGESEVMVMTGDDKQDVGVEGAEEEGSGDEAEEEDDDEEEDEEPPVSDPKVST
jgi:hypothetical protein